MNFKSSKINFDIESLFGNEKYYTQEDVDEYIEQLNKTKKKGDYEELKKKFKNILLAKVDEKTLAHSTPELKIQAPPVDIKKEKDGFFLQGTYVADSAFLTHYRKFTQYVTPNEELHYSSKAISSERPTVSQRLGEKLQRPYYQRQMIAPNLLISNHNAADTQANSKYYLSKERFLVNKDTNRPLDHFSNTQNIFIQDNTMPRDSVEPACFSVKPAALAMTTHPLVQTQFYNGITDARISHQLEKPSYGENLRKHIEDLGGLEDTVSVMRQILSEDNINSIDSDNREFNDSFKNYKNIMVPGVDYTLIQKDPQTLKEEQARYQMEGLMNDPNYNPFLLDPKYTLTALGKHSGLQKTDPLLKSQKLRNERELFLSKPY